MTQETKLCTEVGATKHKGVIYTHIPVSQLCCLGNKNIFGDIYVN